jgi:hypothetical protein
VWLKLSSHDAIGLYWIQGHVRPVPEASGPLLVGQGASAQSNSPQAVDALGNLMGGRLQYAGVYLPDQQWLSDGVDQRFLAPWEHSGDRVILSVPIVPNPRPSNRIPARLSQVRSRISWPTTRMR